MSDSHLNAPRDIVIGTAGHIDHGKTSLVRALTGIDTDRLAEEKRRGISIDLGFAHLALPSGNCVSFIDVPGHERFIRNMLAGACGIEVVLLIVAADESVKPQTREHFDICRLLGVKSGIVVLTKCDLATPEQIAATRAAVDHLRIGSFLAGAPVIATSAVTGQGLDHLMTAIEQLVHSRTFRDAGGLARLPLDRSFALKGFGTIVTGTLWSGTLRVGDTVQLHPSEQQARIRGLHIHRQSVQFATAGHRTAVNLSGIEHSKIARGFVLTHPTSLEDTRTIEASVDWLSGASITSAQENYLLHIGTSEVTTRIQTLSSTLIRLKLAEPVVALPGDRFVLRRPSPAQTIAGGTVIDAFPPKRQSRSKTVSRLERLASCDFAARLELLVDEKENGRRLEELAQITGRTSQELKQVLARAPTLIWSEASQRVVTRTWLDRHRELLIRWLEAFHKKHPSLPGAPSAQTRQGLDASLATIVFGGFSAIRMEGDLVALRGHKVQISSEESAALRRLEQEFRKAAYQPSPPNEILRSAAVEAKNGRALLERLIKDGKLVRVSENLVFHADVLAHIRKSLAAHKGRRFSVPEFKDWTQISRKFAIPLLEYLDHQHVTRREGDNRVVL
jgi:selenocysteine-specific elongation factor